MRKLVATLISMSVMVALTAAPALAYAGTENGTQYCDSPYAVETTVRADGEHKHTIAHSTTTFPNEGYVHNTTKYSDEEDASWTISGGIGYFDYSTSGADCYWTP